MTAVYTSECPTVSLNDVCELASRRPASHCDLNNLISGFACNCGILRQEPALDGFTDIYSHFINRFALRHAAWQCWHFCPETAFVGRMDQYFENHSQRIAARSICGKSAPF